MPGFSGTNCDTNIDDGYSFPGPCGSAPDHSWAFSSYGSNRVRIIAGDQGGTTFCGVQGHNTGVGCGGGAIEFLEVTATQAAACRAEVLNFAASQSGVCH